MFHNPLSWAKKRTRSTQPRLDWLEPRRLLAAKPMAQVSFVETPTMAGSTSYQLQVVGTNKNDSIFIFDDGKHAVGSLRITANGTQLYTNQHPLERVEIATRTGKDRVLYELQGDLVAGPSETISAGSASTMNPAIKGGGDFQMTVNILGSVKASSSLLIIATPDRKGSTSLTVNQSGAVDGDLQVATASMNSTTQRTGPVTFNLNSTGTIGATGSLLAGLVGGSSRNLLNADYTGTNNGDVTLIGIGSGAKDVFTANIQMNTGSTGTVGKNGWSQLTARGATAQVRFTVSRGNDSTSKTGITALLSTSSRRSVTIHTANVSTLSAGKDSTIS